MSKGKYKNLNYAKEYRENHKVQSALSNKQWYKDNKEKANKVTKKYYRYNKKEITERNRQFKQKCVDYKSGKCSICGYNKCLGALDFHHLDPKEKEFVISKMRSKPWEIVKQELDKCILLCSNCHRETHYNDSI